VPGKNSLPVGVSQVFNRKLAAKTDDVAGVVIKISEHATQKQASWQLAQRLCQYFQLTSKPVLTTFLSVILNLAVCALLMAAF
jgi:hypothetical protein